MRVLLADDQIWLRSALRLLLEHETNITVIGEAENARSLQSIIERLQPDLLFFDWQLPGFDTSRARQRFISNLRETHPQLYIAALTNDDKVKSARQLGADAYVNMAEPPEHVLTIVQQAMHNTQSQERQPEGSYSIQ